MIDEFKSRITRIGFNMDEMHSLIEDKTVSFDEVIDLALSHEQPYARYSAWIVTHYIKRDKKLIEPYLGNACDALPNTTHDGQLREILRWFSNLDYQGEKEGELIDFCFNLLTNNSKPVAAKYHAMNILEKVVKREPELAREFILILEEIFPYLSRGGQNKAKKLMKIYES